MPKFHKHLPKIRSYSIRTHYIKYIYKMLTTIVISDTFKNIAYNYSNSDIYH